MNDFRIVSIELVDGKPKIDWEPKANRWMGAEIPAVLKGAETLDVPWEDVLADGGSPGAARPRQDGDSPCGSAGRGRARGLSRRF